MRVVFIARPDLYKTRGGDTVQVEGTAKYLRLLRIHVDIRMADEVIVYEKYDLIHFFNIIDCEDIIGHAMRCNVPYVISTIYVEYREFDRYHRSDMIGLLSRFFSGDAIENIKTIGKFLLKGESLSSWRYLLKGHRGSIQYLMKNAACLLPNSHNEYRRLAKNYGVEATYVVVTNAIDPEIFVNNENKQRTRDLVTCVGRIEGMKNQLNLIGALKKTAYKLVLVGARAPNHGAYDKKCRTEANESVKFTGHLSQGEVVKILRQTRVHVLPSWFETTGLASLEAAVMGCNIVVADRGDVHEYFRDWAIYCDPANPESIRLAVDEAFNKPFVEEMREYIINNCTWDKTATQTLEAYNKVLKTRNQ